MSRVCFYSPAFVTSQNAFILQVCNIKHISFIVEPVANSSTTVSVLLLCLHSPPPPSSFSFFGVLWLFSDAHWNQGLWKVIFHSRKNSVLVSGWQSIFCYVYDEDIQKIPTHSWAFLRHIGPNKKLLIYDLNDSKSSCTATQFISYILWCVAWEMTVVL